MSLYLATPGTADPVKFASSMTAIDIALTRALGTGVLSGLTVDGAGMLQPGEALIGHVVAIAAPISVASLLSASTTNYLYLQMPAAPVCVGADGRDAGTLVVNQSGAAPVSSVLLATVVTGAGSPPPITAVNNAPLGRRNIVLPGNAGTNVAASGYVVALSDESVFFYPASGAAWTATLRPAAARPGSRLTLKNLGAGTVSVSAAAGDTIESAAGGLTLSASSSGTPGGAVRLLPARVPGSNPPAYVWAQI